MHDTMHTKSENINTMWIHLQMKKKIVQIKPSSLSSFSLFLFRWLLVGRCRVQLLLFRDACELYRMFTHHIWHEEVLNCNIYGNFKVKLEWVDEVKI